MKKIKNNQAFVLWFSGLSGSGKTTIALALKQTLVDNGKEVDILDGGIYSLIMLIFDNRFPLPFLSAIPNF